MIFLSAQPDDYYFIWQLELQILNFHSLGIPKNKIHILIGFNRKKGMQRHLSKFMNSNKALASIFTYADERLSCGYPSSIRPHLISKHFEKFPYLETESLFYHDSDIIFRELPDFEKLLSGKKWFASNVKSYLGYDYLYNVGGQDLIDGMAKIIGITPELVKINNDHIGGAQYILNNLCSSFWKNIEKKSEELFIFLEKFNDKLREKALIEGNLEVEIQSWCTDMWVLLWSGWKRGTKLEVIPELNFCWPDEPISEWNNCKILHYSGVYPVENKTIFKKGNYYHYSPINDNNLKYIHSETCSAPIRDLILNIRNDLAKKRADLTDITIVVDLSKFGKSFEHNIDVILRYLTNNAKTNIIVIAFQCIPESLVEVTNLFWVDLQILNDAREFLTNKIRTKWVCLYPPLLIDFNELKNLFLLAHFNDYTTYTVEHIFEVDPFFQELFDKLRDIDVLLLHQAKFQLALPSSDLKICFGLKEKIINTIFVHNIFNSSIINTYSVKYGYKFYSQLGLNDRLIGSKSEMVELKDILVEKKINTNEIKHYTSIEIKVSDSFCWLESTIGSIWVEFHNGLKEVANHNFSLLLGNLDEMNDITFTSGLIGIGFGIESLAQDQFLDINSNIVLEDFDDLFYSSYLFTNKEEISFQNGMVSKLLYLSFRNRNQNSNKNTHRFKSIIHYECLKIILDQIVDYLPLPKIGLEKYSKIDICLLLTIFSSIITNERINYKVLSKIIEMYSFYFFDIFKKASLDITLEIGCCCYLLWQCNKMISDLYFTNNFYNLYSNFKEQLLNQGKDFFKILESNRKEIFQFLNGKHESDFKKLDLDLKNTIFLKLLYSLV